MRGDPFHRPAKGDRFRPSASRDARLADAAAKILEGGAPGSQGWSGRGHNFLNNSGADLPAFSVVGIDRCLKLAAIGDYVHPLKFKWKSPTTSTTLGITQQSIKDGFSGLVQLSGISWCRIMAPIDYDFADASTGHNYLESIPSGRIRILDKPDSPPADEVTLAAVLLGQMGVITCADYYRLETGVGEPTGDFDWQLILLESDTIVASGNFVLGTTTAADLKSAIDTALGPGSNILITGGELPGNTISIHPNRGLLYTKYKFEKLNPNLTPENPGQYAFVTVSSCCIAGG